MEYCKCITANKNTVSSLKWKPELNRYWKPGICTSPSVTLCPQVFLKSPRWLIKKQFWPMRSKWHGCKLGKTRQNNKKELMRVVVQNRQTPVNHGHVRPGALRASLNAPNLFQTMGMGLIFQTTNCKLRFTWIFYYVCCVNTRTREYFRVLSFI